MIGAAASKEAVTRVMMRKKSRVKAQPFHVLIPLRAGRITRPSSHRNPAGVANSPVDAAANRKNKAAAFWAASVLVCLSVAAVASKAANRSASRVAASRVDLR